MSTHEFSMNHENVENDFDHFVVVNIKPHIHVVFLFSLKVKLWITLNEPWVVSVQGYGNGGKAPANIGPGTNTYIAAHNLIKGHAKAYHVYNEEFRAKQKGN